MKLLFASQNLHKRDEMASVLIPHRIIMPQEAGFDYSFEEVAPTFLGNALGKAEYLYRLCGQPVIADDSGLSVDALEGAPGINTAGYGLDVFGRMLDASEKNRYLLENLKGVPYEKRTARFICALALVFSEGREFLVQETVEGHIATQPAGIGGFGYDPVFIENHSGITMAELPEGTKNLISHRGRAARRMLAIIATLEQEESYHVC
ncbi:MAG: non-canonical purine NTP pyrophosphatase [Sphaerochaetaceae bacterium]